MTIRELIQFLRQYNENVEVRLEVDDDSFIRAPKIQRIGTTKDNIVLLSEAPYNTDIVATLWIDPEYTD